MADLPPDTPDDARVERGRGSNTGAPRWAKVFGIIAAVVVLVFVILLLSGGGHGPGRHIPGGDTGGHTPPAVHTPPSQHP